MQSLFYLCAALSVGVICGTVAGGVTRGTRQKKYTDEQVKRGLRFWKMGSRILTYITFVFLALGFIWCVYFLVLGAVSPSHTEYADNMSELIVSVLTVVSIAFAFYEFIRRK
ncbi:transporter [Neobittarella massiliensis]|uniref:Transporter n=1 Tax=Neobittarella massiliensis (ex Bilen et al. 2018) TaxID=2041842 RepID=A0A8J6LYE9_9FIRM|nr:transporter [Neobittarella massiliensis]MBC3515478.1 transporter [Neobittarella massiliensis]